MTLSGRVVLVTGASQGIGRACALKLAASGAAVAAAARGQEKLSELVQQIEASGGKAAAFPADVADEQQIKTAFKTALEKFGKIDILVNNSARSFLRSLLDLREDGWDKVFNTNVKAVGKTLDLLRPFPFLPLAELTREGVQSYVDAQKALMDVMLKHRNGHKREAKKARHAKRPVRAARREGAAAGQAVA